MRKARSLIAAFLVVLIQVTPGPLGLRPAHAIIPAAALVPLAVGALISGTLVAGAGVYRPSSFSPSDFSIDTSTGAIHTGVLVAKMIGVGAEAKMMGYAKSLSLTYDKVSEWVKAHPLEFPLLKAGIDASEVPLPYTPVAGWVYDAQNGTTRKVLTIGTTNHTIWYGYTWASVVTTTPLDLGGGVRKQSTTSPTIYWNFQPYGSNAYSLDYATVTEQIVTDPVTSRPSTVDPALFAPAVPVTEAAKAEADNIVRDYPPAISSDTTPAPFTQEQIAAAQAAIAALSAQSAADEAAAAAAADPTNTALQVAAAQARQAADQATIVAQGKELELDTTPAEETETDIPYNPSALSGSYTLPAVDFGARFQTFIDAIKATSFFSLPASIASGIPASSVSVLTIDGGETLGTHDFDFADMDNLWAILRSVFLTGFMFVSIRIVCLHR